MIKEYWLGTSMALGTAFLLGLSSPLAKIISSTGLSQISVMCYRSIVVVVLVGAFLCWKEGIQVFFLSRSVFQQYLSIAILGSVMNSTGFLISVVYLTIPQALMIHFSYPIVTIAASAFFSREKPTKIHFAAALMIIIGLFVGFAPWSGPTDPFSRVGLFWAALSVLGVSGQMLLTRRLMISGTPRPLLQLFFTYLFGGVILLIGKSLTLGWSDLKAITPAILALMHYPSMVSGLLGFWLLYSALRYIPASTASLICSLELVFAILFSSVLFKEPHPMNEYVGCMIIFVAVGSSMLFQKE